MFVPYVANVPDTTRFPAPVAQGNTSGTSMGVSARTSGDSPWLFQSDSHLSATADSADASARSVSDEIQAMNIANEFASREAQKTREWQEYYERNKYQWAMQGMREAGLNPILAYQLASGGSASSATAQPTKANIASAYSAEYNRIVGESANAVKGIGSILSLIAVLGAVAMRKIL